MSFGSQFFLIVSPHLSTSSEVFLIWILVVSVKRKGKCSGSSSTFLHFSIWNLLPPLLKLDTVISHWLWEYNHLQTHTQLKAWLAMVIGAKASAPECSMVIPFSPERPIKTYVHRCERKCQCHHNLCLPAKWCRTNDYQRSAESHDHEWIEP